MLSIISCFCFSPPLKYLCAEGASSSLLGFFFSAYEISHCRTTDSRAFLAPVVPCGVLTLWTVFIEREAQSSRSRSPSHLRAGSSEQVFSSEEPMKNRRLLSSPLSLPLFRPVSFLHDRRHYCLCHLCWSPS